MFILQSSTMRLHPQTTYNSYIILKASSMFKNPFCRISNRTSSSLSFFWSSPFFDFTQIFFYSKTKKEIIRIFHTTPVCVCYILCDGWVDALYFIRGPYVLMGVLFPEIYTQLETNKKDIKWKPTDTYHRIYIRTTQQR